MGSIFPEFNNVDNKEEPNDENIENDKIIENIEEKKIKVEIPLINGSWEKIYNIETPLNKVSSDFILENNMNSKHDNHYIVFYYNNETIEMNSSPLKSLIISDISIIHITYQIKDIDDTESSEENEFISIVGKPFSDPFQIITFSIKSKKFKTLFLDRRKFKQNGFDKFGIDSAYCNGNNYLYISGGTNPTTNKTMGLFYAINLKKVIINEPINMIPKKNHSMIYIEKKVYIIGGDEVNCIVYDVDNKKMIKWKNLKDKRFEPSLIRHNNYLFCFDTSNKYTNNYENIFNFEKIKLFNESSQWEIVHPKITPNIINSVFSQKFFGLVVDSKDNILFVGGIYDNENKEKEIENNLTNLQYNTNTNTIEKSDIEFKNISFGEKCFLPLDNKTYFILPNFNKRSPKIIYFHKFRDIIEINSYHLNSHPQKNINKVKTSQIKQLLDGINFNIPNKSLNHKSRNNNLKNINDFKKISNTVDFNNESIQINQELKNFFNNKNITINIINKNEEENEDIESETQNNYLNNEMIKLNLSIDESFLENEKETKKSKKDKNRMIKNNINNEHISNRNTNNNINTDNNNNLDNKSLNKQEIKSQKSKNSKKVEINPVQIIINKIDDDNLNNNRDNSNINLKNYNDEKICDYQNKIIKKIVYVENSDLFIRYHSSLDNRFNKNFYINNILQTIKRKRNAPPIKNNIKLKKLIRKVNKNDFSESKNNQNF